MSTVTIYPRIPNEEWRRHAACSFSADLTLWDAAVDGEQPEEKERRHKLVGEKCAESVDATRPPAEQRWAS